MESRYEDTTPNVRKIIDTTKEQFFVEYCFREKIELKAGVIGEHDEQ